MRIEVESHLQALLAQEDTDGDKRITIRDRGPRVYSLDGLEVRGTYALSNLLQDLAAARQAGQAWLECSLDQFHEPPTRRLSRSIRERCWAGLTRTLDAAHLAQVLEDPKMPGPPRLYVPWHDEVGFRYYSSLGGDFEMVRLPKTITPEYVLGLNAAPGLLALACGVDGQPLPYVVPGGRFNELYGWDTYFIGLGLLQDGLVEQARQLVEHQVYQIEHYGKVLNANRSYYLTRSQPPFLTAFARAVFEHTQDSKWLERVLRVALHEYRTVWTSGPRLLDNGLSRYLGEGIGMPPETEHGHFDEVLTPYAERLGLSLEEFGRQYLDRRLSVPELDHYFTHDRTVRESGHDTSYRLEGRAAHLATVDLNSLLYRYERDFSELLDGVFPSGLSDFPDASQWQGRAQQRQARMTELCWDEPAGQFFDFDFTLGERTGYESATGLWPLWAGLATPQQAERIVAGLLSRLSAPGGVLSGTEASRGDLGPGRPARQWDYPNGWAPHQMMAWQGLLDYGFTSEAQELARRWLHMMTRNAVDFNGVIPEKYDLVKCSHEVFAEYGNVGTEFDYITQEGFGWSNASYQLGLQLLPVNERTQLDQIARTRDAP